ncbi:MAG: hypothetical protein MUE59_09295 [Thiobacillaceae bacterium]|nr:hypothetical protein [Thiobacillaceae bacterium]
MALVCRTARADKAAATHTPPPGPPERTALLGAVRSALRLNPGASRFNVFHLRRAGNWAYFEGNEVIALDDHSWQETDLTVKALLVHRGSAWRVEVLWTLPGTDSAWRVEVLWTLPGTDRFALAAFEQRLATLRQTHHLPGELFP